MTNKYFQKASLGCSLSEDEVKELATFLGVRISIKKIVFMIIISLLFFILFLFFLGVFTFYDGNNFLLALTTILYIAGMILYNAGFFTKRVIEYSKAIDSFYDSALIDHNNQVRMFTWHIPTPESYIQKKNVLFFTDDYFFYIKEDFLKQSGYFLKSKFITKYNKFPTLKIYDPDAMNKREISFKLSDISKYRLVGEVVDIPEHEGIEEYSHSFQKQTFDNYVEIELKNFQVIRLGTNVYTELKRIIPLKEDE